MIGNSQTLQFKNYLVTPRGYLNRKPHTGKEIINTAVEESGGRWKPSPGLIYPLLGRLLDEDLIEETKDGKYKVSQKGKTTLDDLDSFNNIIKKQLDTIFRVGNISRFVAMDVLERVTILGNLLSSNVEKMTKNEAEKYRKFLESELKKIDGISKSK
jgi:DNA-binding PadR family transcriptional regulator